MLQFNYSQLYNKQVQEYLTVEMLYHLKTSIFLFVFFKPMCAMLLLRTGQTVGVVARLSACRGDVVLTTAFVVQFGVS